MRETPEHEDLLDERTQNILIAVVQSFIQSADPVGSRTISRRFDFGLSPATIRNVMSDLEELGFLEQPHTSAGRIPTDKGYRLYVNYLQTLEMPSLEEAELISKRYRTYQGVTDEVISTTSQLLSEVSRYAGIVLCTFSNAIFKQIEFIKIRGKQVLAIFVMQSAIVHNKVMTLDEDLSQDELRTISNYLNQEFSGQSLPTIRQRVLERMNEEKAQYDLLAQQAMTIGAKTFESSVLDEADIYLGGTSNILDQPEFMMNVEHMKELFKAFEEKSRLIRILDRCIAEVGINVIIGSETSLGDIHDCSFVTHTYSYDDQTMGVLGVVGPKRMAYPRMMALVDYTADVVSRTLTRGQGLE